MRDLGVLLDDFQPLQNGHHRALKTMAGECRHILILVLGANRPTTVLTPFTVAQRIDMIDRLADHDGQNYAVAAIPDTPWDDAAWTGEIVRAIEAHLDSLGMTRDADIGLACFRGRGLIARQPAIPDTWTWIDLGTAPLEIDTAAVRADYLRGGTDYRTRCPDPVGTILDWAYDRPAYRSLHKDARAVDQLQARYGNGPFHAADAVLIHRNSVLTVARGNRPNRNARAFPGGLIEKGETALEAALRELSEEVLFEGSFTNAEIPALSPSAVLESDRPTRDPRGHWTTIAHLLRLPDASEPPSVKARSDAARARFMPISEVQPQRFWSDHGFLLPQLLRIERKR